MTKRLTRQPAWLLIALLAGNALAEQPPERSDAAVPAVAVAAGVANVTHSSTLGYALLPARFRHGAVRASQTGDAASRQAASTLPPMDYRDRAPLITRLKELDGLRLLTFWETRAFAVFFGVSREGIAGLNITQKKDPSADKDEDAEDSRPAEPVPEPTHLAASSYRR